MQGGCGGSGRVHLCTPLIFKLHALGLCFPIVIVVVIVIVAFAVLFASRVVLWWWVVGFGFVVLVVVLVVVLWAVVVGVRVCLLLPNCEHPLRGVQRVKSCSLFAALGVDWFSRDRYSVSPGLGCEHVHALTIPCTPYVWCVWSIFSVRVCVVLLCKTFDAELL